MGLAVNSECSECGKRTAYAVYLCADCRKKMLEHEQLEFSEDVSCPECGKLEHSCRCGYFAYLEDY